MQVTIETAGEHEGFYNPSRPHPTLGYRSPDYYEKMTAAA